MSLQSLPIRTVVFVSAAALSLLSSPPPAAAATCDSSDALTLGAPTSVGPLEAHTVRCFDVKTPTRGLLLLSADLAGEAPRLTLRSCDGRSPRDVGPVWAGERVVETRGPSRLEVCVTAQDPRRPTDGGVLHTAFTPIEKNQQIEVEPDGHKNQQIEVEPDGHKNQQIEVEPDGYTVGAEAFDAALRRLCAPAKAGGLHNETAACATPIASTGTFGVQLRGQDSRRMVAFELAELSDLQAAVSGVNAAAELLDDRGRRIQALRAGDETFTTLPAGLYFLALRGRGDIDLELHTGGLEDPRSRFENQRP